MTRLTGIKLLRDLSLYPKGILLKSPRPRFEISSSFALHDIGQAHEGNFKPRLMPYVLQNFFAYIKGAFLMK